MSWADEICVSCGLCCTSLSVVRITADDLERLMQGYHLTREQAGRLVQGRPGGAGEFKILMQTTAACPSLSSNAGQYCCQAYEHRPGICREYECHILAFAKEWLKQHGENQSVEERNPFHSARDEDELSQQVQHAIREMRASFLQECVTNQNNPDFRQPEHLPELIQTLSGAEFQNTFPPAGVRSPGSESSRGDGVPV
jgi:Fe-S-cluster containining protein